jgi:hypothetical protein
VIQGAQNIIKKYRPIVAFEQHLTTDNYKEIITNLETFEYNVYLINEILPGCKFDCRNLIAFSKELKIDIERINDYLGSRVLLLMNQSVKESSEFFGDVYGTSMSGNVYKTVTGYKHKHKDLIIYAVYDSQYTKLIAVNKDGVWIEGRYLLGYVNISSACSISDAFDSAYGVETNKNAYTVGFQS